MMRHDRNALYCVNNFVNIDTSYYIIILYM